MGQVSGPPGMAEGGRALGRQGRRLLPAAARAAELCQVGVGGAAGSSLGPARGGAAGAEKEGGEEKGPGRHSGNQKQIQTLAGPSGEGPGSQEFAVGRGLEGKTQPRSPWGTTQQGRWSAARF